MAGQSRVCFKFPTFPTLWCNGPQPFWHQGPVSWKTFFPLAWMRVGVGNGSGGDVSDGERWGAADEALLARLPAAHLLLCGPLLTAPGSKACGLGTPALVNWGAWRLCASRHLRSQSTKLPVEGAMLNPSSTPEMGSFSCVCVRISFIIWVSEHPACCSWKGGTGYIVSGKSREKRDGLLIIFQLETMCKS